MRSHIRCLFFWLMDRIVYWEPDEQFKRFLKVPAAVIKLLK